MSASDEIKLWCWVLGDTCERVFPVIIESSAHIEDLKKAIKGKKLSFKDISADSIIGGLGALRLFQAEFVINQLASPRRHVYILQ